MKIENFQLWKVDCCSEQWWRVLWRRLSSTQHSQVSGNKCNFEFSHRFHCSTNLTMIDLKCSNQSKEILKFSDFLISVKSFKKVLSSSALDVISIERLISLTNLEQLNKKKIYYKTKRLSFAMCN